MKKALNFLFMVLKIVLILVAFVMTFYGLMTTFKRLDKPLLDGMNTYIPFALLFVCFCINIIGKQKKVNDNILFNFACVLSLAAIFYISYRAKFDTNIVLYYRYKIDFNPTFFADNLSAIQIMLYCLSGADVVLMVLHFLNKPKKGIKETVSNVEAQVEPKNDTILGLNVIGDPSTITVAPAVSSANNDPVDEVETLI